MKQTHDKKIAEILSLITKKLSEVNESTQKIGELKRESNSENETPQLALQTITGTQSLRDTLEFMKRSKK